MTAVSGLAPAHARVSALVAGPREDRLGAPVPRGSYSIEILPGSAAAPNRSRVSPPSCW
ncbi:hypothetical protein [Amycolatopsis albispora]|uniref:hypothetical protein n=1 Tax=Amycolatopsis albispora TaxID=1804986 RepID=UPI0013B3CDCF|nr:hypothetical protein [Amycolatopsis albispora]